MPDGDTLDKIVTPSPAPQDPPESTTHFGYRDVPTGDKARLVGEVFRSVAGRYDLMNDLMSGGMHRAWKAFAAARSGLRPGDAVLDVAAGSGDMARRFAAQVGEGGTVILSDINPAMLANGRQAMVDAGYLGRAHCAIGDAENLPFPDNSFHCVCIAFGLRNVTDKARALAAMYRVLLPGGRLLVLEFSRPLLPALERIYSSYSFRVIPKIGRLVTGDEDSYRYLVESIRRHPDQQALRGMMETAGFEDVTVNNLSAGIVALHTGFKY